jgi:acyl-CoA reductase-like NAD-dependent aldehyde dehydrogenase
MAVPIHIPAIRRGAAYESLDTVEVTDPRNGTVLARVSQVGGGIVRRDLAKIGESRRALAKLSTDELLGICSRAGDLFMNAGLPMGSSIQTPQQFIETLSTTSGLPHTLCRRNMHKIHEVFTQMPQILRGLTRGLDHRILDAGMGEQDGILLNYCPVTDSIGVVLPSNSPGVNSLWMPAIALKVPVVLKPGRDEPWTPYRIIQAFTAAGCPAGAFSYYPTDHEGAGAILKACGRARRRHRRGRGGRSRRR